ncbi:ArsR/SmtB family transcription factor [Tenuibacillus multivorans]|uniref:ArsR family transcriptional regulator n=1 Tax=Tenuibacillus multivorans TaxID=237069 RepID=A0A1G9WN28_9BACI|nr:metalloregulator ArsR/SmtB family transcription factor [Tenuibacillus multivorans]GEL78010.1 transcriptional regulator [Tenuibacillus multivorans]SDM85601.1 ArsR family transcriptional regulator [Tenuibacillus multivorans]
MSKYKNDYSKQFSEMFKALSNEHRLEIFLYLAKNCFPGELSTDKEMRASVGKLGEGLGIAPSTISHHLKELRQSGLIRMERKGKTIECWIEPDTLEDLIQFFQQAKGGK